MSQADFGEQLLELLTSGADWNLYGHRFERVHPAVAAELIESLEDDELLTVLSRIPQPYRAEVFSHLGADRQPALIAALPPDEAAALIASMAADDRVDLIQQLEIPVRRRVLDALDPAVRRDIERLALYATGTAGAIMSTDVATLKANLTVAEAIEQLRRMASEKETIYYNYVIDQHGKLLGIVSLRDLILAEPHTRLTDVMNPNVVAAWVDDDQAVVADKIREYDLLALPILHGDHRLAGVVTVDDAIDVSDEEATEDFHRMASVGVLTTGVRGASAWLLYRKRVPWLLALVFVNIFSGAGIAFFEETIAAYVALVFFLPLLIDSGGNAGSQSATLMIRAMATGDVRMRDWFTLLTKEVVVALAIGATMAAAVSLIGAWRAPEVTAVVAGTMVCVVLTGSLIGMSLPFVLTKLKMDPATASAPLITSIADIAGVMIYFGMATWWLGIGTH